MIKLKTQHKNKKQKQKEQFSLVSLGLNRLFRKTYKHNNFQKRREHSESIQLRGAMNKPIK